MGSWKRHQKLKSKVGRIVEGTEIDGASVHSFAPTQTKKKTKKKTEEDYDSEFSEVLRKDRNSKKYQQEISRTIEQAIFPDERTRELVELANSNNTYSSAELRKMGLFDAAGSRSYLLNPTEAKSHMLTLKRSLKDSGKITNWSTPVDENMILEYMRNPTSNKMVKNQYDLYRNKNEYIDRLNKLIPMEILMPLGGAGFVGHELNKE